MTAPLQITDILAMIPHRYPLLLVDRVLEVVPGESAHGLKNVTMNEPHFMGHFPGHPIMPGVLIIEALAQTAAVLVVKTLGEHVAGKLVYFTSIEEAKFRKPVTPGDSLHLYVKIIRSRGMLYKLEARAEVNGEVTTEAIISAMIMDK